MKKVTREEAENMLFKDQGKSYLRLCIEQMKPGDILEIEPADCGNKRGPFETVSRASTTRRQYTVKTLLNKKGWLVERVS